jgi:hypothetical protein
MSNGPHAYARAHAHVSLPTLATSSWSHRARRPSPLSARSCG